MIIYVKILLYKKEGRNLKDCLKNKIMYPEENPGFATNRRAGTLGELQVML